MSDCFCSPSDLFKENYFCPCYYGECSQKHDCSYTGIIGLASSPKRLALLCALPSCGLPWQKFEYLLSKCIHIGAGEMAQWVKHKDQSWDPQHPHEEAGRCVRPACNTALEK